MIASIVRIIFNLLNLVVLSDIIVSFFLSPYHPVREALDKIVNPFLSPIRKILPQTGMFDFSPVVLVILLQVLEYLILIKLK